MEQAKRREQIVKAAIETIAALGYAQASIGQITKRAGIGKGVFTYHFESKDDLMEQIVHEVYGAAARFMQPRIESQTTPGRMLEAYIESNLAFMGAHRDYIIALIEVVSNARTPDGQLRFAGSSDDPILAPLIEILKWGQDTSEFKPFTERSARITATAIRHVIDGVAGRLAANPDFDIPGFSEELVSLFLSAVRNPLAATEPTREGGQLS